MKKVFIGAVLVGLMSVLSLSFAQKQSITFGVSYLGGNSFQGSVEGADYVTDTTAVVVGVSADVNDASLTLGVKQDLFEVAGADVYGVLRGGGGVQFNGDNRGFYLVNAGAGVVLTNGLTLEGGAVYTQEFMTKRMKQVIVPQVTVGWTFNLPQ